MTPFNIRKRLKSMITGTGGGPSPDELCATTFVLPDGSRRTIQVEKHYSILMAADANGFTISTGRRAGGTCPDGECDSCRVEVLNGAGLTPMGDAERESMDNHTAGLPHEGRARTKAPPRGPNTRLGCHAKIVGPGAVIQITELFDPDTIKGTEVEV